MPSFHKEFSKESQPSLSRRYDGTDMTDTPDLPITSENLDPAEQAGERVSGQVDSQENEPTSERAGEQYVVPAPFAASKRRMPRDRTVLTAAVVAALVGGGVGAGVGYAVSGNSNGRPAASPVVSSAGSGGLNAGASGASGADAVSAVATKVMPSVVTITVTPDASGAGGAGGADGGGSGGDLGTGIILNKSGEILTNNHVVAAAANGGYTITVTFYGGTNTSATIVDRDPTSDLAIIRVSGISSLVPATLGDSTGVQIGEQVVAIGAPLGRADTVTSGIVSALNRPVIPASDDGSSGQGSQPSTSTTALDAIQTDAAINPGNSGGPLIDMNGRVIGVNSAIESTGSDSLDGGQGGSIGLGFAIPISQAKPVISELEAKAPPTHAVLGVSVRDSSATAAHTGAMLAGLTAGGSAADGGLKQGDEVIKIDDQQIDDSDALEAAVHSYRPGTAVTITYIRDGRTATTTATLASAGSTDSAGSAAG
jgi:putative serine protease PepD